MRDFPGKTAFVTGGASGAMTAGDPCRGEHEQAQPDVDLRDTVDS